MSSNNAACDQFLIRKFQEKVVPDSAELKNNTFYFCLIRQSCEEILWEPVAYIVIRIIFLYAISYGFKIACLFFFSAMLTWISMYLCFWL